MDGYAPFWPQSPYCQSCGSPAHFTNINSIPNRNNNNGNANASTNINMNACCGGQGDRIARGYYYGGDHMGGAGSDHHMMSRCKCKSQSQSTSSESDKGNKGVGGEALRNLEDRVRNLEREVILQPMRNRYGRFYPGFSEGVRPLREFFGEWPQFLDHYGIPSGGSPLLEMMGYPSDMHVPNEARRAMQLVPLITQLGARREANNIEQLLQNYLQSQGMGVNGIGMGVYLGMGMVMGMSPWQMGMGPNYGRMRRMGSGDFRRRSCWNGGQRRGSYHYSVPRGGMGLGIGGGSMMGWV